MLAIFGVIFLVLIVKFLYDNFATNNAANTWEWYKDNYPEEAHRLDNNRGINSNVKPKNDVTRQQLSLYELANNLNTSPDKAREVYISKLNEVVHAADERDYMLNNLRMKKLEEAKTKNIDPDDGVAALMHLWASQYFLSDMFKSKLKSKTNPSTMFGSNKEENRQKIKNASEILFEEFPEVEQLVKKGDRAELIEYLKKHPRAFTLWMESLQK
jgi:hypothetical protein